MKLVQVVGGLGSQMLAYALYLSLKEKNKNNEKIICDFSWFKYNNCHNGAEIYRIFNLKEEYTNVIVRFILNSNSLLGKILRKICYILKIFRNYSAEIKNYNFDSEVFLQKGNVRFLQCWTSWKYFENIQNLITEKFIFPEIQDEKNKKILVKILSTNSVSIHVRRGDAVGSELGSLVNIDFYLKAIDYIESKIENPIFYIFSDDIEWCKENFNIKNKFFINWNHNHESYKDMQLMSSCKHNIIPNSSFSWWSAYLNKNKQKIVISPLKWGDLKYGAELKDMNLKNWYLIDNK
jgi:hypothetical protein